MSEQITFQEYVRRVVGNPRRSDEFKTLVDLLGLPAIEKILSGATTVQASDFYKARRANV
jgi:hypothetical protein